MFRGINRHSPIARVRPHNERMQTSAYLLRVVKRKLVADGRIEDPQTRPFRHRFDWAYGGIEGVVFADTTSEARALIKKNLGLPKKKRLPREVEIIRSINDGTEPGSTRASVRGTTQPDAG